VKDVLGKECKNKVPGIGEVPARILVISDYLTYEAEKNNIPLNQNELELLYKWFEAINIPKNQLFITSILKCANYNTKVEREHIEQCSYYLDKQIEILNPAFIFTIGDIAYPV
jgi:DNA polymerase